MLLEGCSRSCQADTYSWPMEEQMRLFLCHAISRSAAPHGLSRGGCFSSLLWLYVGLLLAWSKCQTRLRCNAAGQLPSDHVSSTDLAGPLEEQMGLLLCHAIMQSVAPHQLS